MVGEVVRMLVVLRWSWLFCLSESCDEGGMYGYTMRCVVVNEAVIRVSIQFGYQGLFI